MTIAISERAGCLTNRTLHLILMPTEACNFRCSYCYESFLLKRMEPRVVAGLKRLLERRAAGLGSLEISWFGGEPLLAGDVIEDVMRHVRDLRGTHSNLRVASDITTNGYRLTESVASGLLDLGIRRFQISLDGPREHHDRTRVRPGGRGTFDRIWENLRALKGNPARFQVTLRLHVDGENVGSMPGFLREIAREFSDDRRFDVFVRAIARLGGPRDASLPILDEKDASDTLARLRAQAVEAGLPLAAANEGEAICYAARANSLLVRADGRLNKCTVALDHPSNQVGRLEEDGTIHLRADQMLAWMRGIETGDAEELSCPLRGISSWQASRSGGSARTVSLALAPASPSAP